MATVKEVKDLKARVAELETEVDQLKSECKGYVDLMVKFTQQVATALGLIIIPPA